MAMELASFAGQPAIALRAPDGATASVLLHGAHLVSWQPSGSDEQLYLSPTSAYGGKASVRGGVPVIFPQFNERGPLPRHGFARTRTWQAVESFVRGDHAIAVLRLVDDDETRAVWPHAFEAELTVSVAARQLEVELAVTNTGGEAFAFTAALHTYLRCDDTRHAQLEGLQDCEFEDALRNGEMHRQWGSVLSVADAVDRVYHDAREPLLLREPGRRVHVAMRGFEDAVVWNPGAAGAAKLADMPDGDWQRMVCVEAARIRRPVALAPGADWAGMQVLSAA